MPWTEITWPQYQRATQRYASDLTDGAWELLAPFMPEPSLLGRPRTTDLRDVVDALLYTASTGCQWRQLPKDFPPYSTVQGYFYRWAKGGKLPRINYALVIAPREAVGREASPTAGVIDSQSVKTTEAPARAAMTPARRSTGASGTSLPTLWAVEIIKRSDIAKGFEVLPRRWVVERPFAWLGRRRRLAKDFEATISSATAWLLWHISACSPDGWHEFDAE
jgi:transposase